MTAKNLVNALAHEPMMQLQPNLIQMSPILKHTLISRSGDYRFQGRGHRRHS